MDFLSTLDPVMAAGFVIVLALVAWVAARIILKMTGKLLSCLVTTAIAAGLVYLALRYLF